MTRLNAFRASAIALVLVLASFGAITTASPAEAATFNNNYNGQDSYRIYGSTTLKYTNRHAAFSLSIYVVEARSSTKNTTREDVNAPYSIAMYDANGRLVWSSSGQRSRVYYVGSNVAKIVVTPAQPYVGAAVMWNRA